MKTIALIITMTMLSSPALLRAQELSDQNKRQIAAIDDQIARAKDNIARIKEMPVEFAGILLLMGTDSPVRNPTEEQVLRLVSERKVKLAAQLADVEKELATIEAEKKNVPVEFMELAKAMEYVATEKANLIWSQIADAQEDANYINAGNPGTGGQGLIDRKLALLNQTATFLPKQKKLILGQDPRPTSK